jgi:hypothetical protein
MARGRVQNGVWIDPDCSIHIIDGVIISSGSLSGYSTISKFGAAPDFDTDDNEVTVWDGAEDGQDWENMRYDYSDTADIDKITSSSASDTEPIEIQGLDGNLALVTQTITLTGLTSATLTTPLKRVFRAKNVGTSDLVGHVFVHYGPITLGIPDSATSVRAIIHPGNNQTEMAVYTIPAGKTGYLTSVYGGTAGASKSSNYIFRLYARPSGTVFQLKDRFVANEAGSPFTQHLFKNGLKFAAGTDLELTGQAAAAGVTAAAIIGGFEITLVDN